MKNKNFVFIFYILLTGCVGLNKKYFISYQSDRHFIKSSVSDSKTDSIIIFFSGDYNGMMKIFNNEKNIFNGFLYSPHLKSFQPKPVIHFKNEDSAIIKICYREYNIDLLIERNEYPYLDISPPKSRIEEYDNKWCFLYQKFRY